MTYMNASLEAILPVFGVIALGWLARHFRLVPDTTWPAVNAFGYWLLYPAFLFITIAKADFSGPDARLFLACLLISFACMSAICLSLRLVFRGDGPAFTSVFQAGLRWNGFIVLAAAPGLYGPEGTALVALGFGPVVALVNVMSVAVLARWGRNDVVPSLSGALSELVRNPLVLGSLAGIIANLSGLATYLGLFRTTLGFLGNAAMPVALLCVGASLSLAGFTNRPVHVIVGTATKLFIAPCVMWAVAVMLGLSPMATLVAIGIASTSVAPASFVLAREMGGDVPLMAALVTLSTILAALTIPFWYAVVSAA
jgi:malonate transporter and related proteins